MALALHLQRLAAGAGKCAVRTTSKPLVRHAGTAIGVLVFGCYLPYRLHQQTPLKTTTGGRNRGPRLGFLS